MSWMVRSKNSGGNRLLHRSTGLLTAAAVIAGTVVGTATPVLAADTTPPPAPQNLMLSPTSTSTDGTVVLTWDRSAATDVAYYQVFRTQLNTPAANEVTYLDSTDDASNFFIDNAPSEGAFRYAVMAVDTSGNASPASTWAAINVDLPANGAGTIQPDTTAPATVTNLSTGAAFTANRTVGVNWTGDTAPDLWRYLVYRASGTGTPTMVGYVEPGFSTFSDVLTADGTYRYHVIAQDKTGNTSPAPAAVQVGVDTIAPTIAITAPVNGQSYASNSSLTIAATITDAVAGYEASAVKYYLDNNLLASPALQLNTLAAGAHVVTVEVTDKAGNISRATATFLVNTTSANPSAPQNLTAPAITKSRSVSLTWSAPLTGTVSIYKVYRSVSGQQAVMVGATAAGTTTWLDSVPADGAYTYYVVAENGTTASPQSNLVAVAVDTAAPVITVTAPKAGATYQRTGTLAPQVTVTDAISGYEAAQVRYLLDGTALTGAINLAGLAEGDHTFKVEATDKAGNAAVKSVTFKVSATAGEPDEDDDDDDEDQNDDFISLLTSLRSQIHHGHYTALMAKARAGQYSNVVKHIMKHRGKFISPAAADKLLKALGAMQDDDGPEDDEAGSTSWSNNTSKGRGRK